MESHHLTCRAAILMPRASKIALLEIARVKVSRQQVGEHVATRLTVFGCNVLDLRAWIHRAVNNGSGRGLVRLLRAPQCEERSCGAMSLRP